MVRVDITVGHKNYDVHSDQVKIRIYNLFYLKKKEVNTKFKQFI